MASILITRRGSWCRFQLRIIECGSKKNIELGTGHEMQILEVCLDASARLDERQLRYLRDANKQARWKERLWTS